MARADWRVSGGTVPNWGLQGVENEAVEQLAFADRVLLNKIDLVTEEDLKRVEGRIRGINKFAPIERCQQSTVAVDSVLNIKGFDLQRTSFIIIILTP